MEALLPLGAAFVAAVVLTWRHQRRDRRRERGEQLVENFDADARKVLAVAWREARAKGIAAPGPAAVLLGLLEVEAFAAALVRVGGVPAEVVGRARDALASDARTGPEAWQAVARASLGAKSVGRVATCVGLWVQLARTSAADLVSPASPYALSFLLVHGCEEPSVTSQGLELQVVLKNDDHTTRAHVLEILSEVFELGEADAEARTQETHEHGRAVIGRYDRETARARIEAARARSRTARFPLWIASEPV